MSGSLLLLKAAEAPSVRLICFPFAGGTAAFTRSWVRKLPPWVELLGVQYPGRSAQSDDTLLCTPQEISAAIVDDIASLPELPLVLFGYSLGSFIAYETAVLLEKLDANRPAALVVAAARAPHIPRKGSPVSTLPEADFVQRLREYGGAPDAILQNTDLIRFYLPVLRADFSTAETYRRQHIDLVSCPITAMAGVLDQSVDVSAIDAWRSYTHNAFKLWQFDGGHFFLTQHADSVFSAVSEVLERCSSCAISHSESNLPNDERVVPDREAELSGEVQQRD